MSRIKLMASAASLIFAFAACSGDGEPEGAATEPTEPAQSVAFITPEDGATVTSPVQVSMQATGFRLEPAGPVNEGAGHLHIMVNTDCVTPGQVIPSDAFHLHYGMGQTEAELTLGPGQHTLCLQAADGLHTALDLTDTITINVGE